MNKLFLNSFFAFLALTLCSCGPTNPNKVPENPDTNGPSEPGGDNKDPENPGEPETPVEKYESLTLEMVKDMPVVFNNKWKANTYEVPRKLYTQYELIDKRTDGTTEVIASKETYKVAYDLDKLKAYLSIKMESSEGVLLDATGNQNYDGTDLINTVNGQTNKIACTKEEAIALIKDDTPYKYAFGHATATMYEDTFNLPNEVQLYKEQIKNNKNDSATKVDEEDYRYYEEKDKLLIDVNLLGKDLKIGLSDGTETSINKYHLDVSQTYVKGICTTYTYVYDVMETVDGSKMGQTITKTLTATSDFDIESIVK